jgi:hypothetical protein
VIDDSEKVFLDALKEMMPSFKPEFPPNLQMIGKSVISYLVDEIDEFQTLVKNALEDEFKTLVNGIKDDCTDIIDGINGLFDGDIAKTMGDLENVAKGMDSNCFSPLWNVAHNLGLSTGSSDGEETAVGDKWDWEVAGSTDYFGEQFSIGIAAAITIAQSADMTANGLYPLPKFAAQGQAQLLLGGGTYVKTDDSGKVKLESEDRFEVGIQTQVAACIDILGTPLLSCADQSTGFLSSLKPDVSISFNKGAPDGQNGFGATIEIGIPAPELGGAIHIGLAWNVNTDGTTPFSGISFAFVPGETEPSLLAWATYASYWPIHWLTYDWDEEQVPVQEIGEGKMKNVLPQMAQKTPPQICMFEPAKETKKPTDDDTPNQWAPCKNPDDCTNYNVDLISDNGMAAWYKEVTAIRNCNQWYDCGGFWKRKDGYFWAMDQKAATKLQPSDDSTGSYLKSCSLST